MNFPPAFWLRLSCAAALLGTSGAAHAQSDAKVNLSGPRLSAAAQANFDAQLSALRSEKAALSCAQRKLASHLALALPAQRARIAGTLKSFRGFAATDGSGRSDVIISGTVTPALLSAIARAGGQVTQVIGEEGAVRARLSPSGAASVAALDEVRRIRPYMAPVTRTGSVSSEGDLAQAVASTRALFKVSGRGIKIGVLSDGVDSLKTSQSSGELGTVTVIKDAGGAAQNGSGDEGTAMLEIVHDLAPAASLYFATGDGGQENFAANIRLLRAAGCKIIVDDLAYFDEGVYQDGTVARAVNDVTADGALFFSAAGNDGNLDAGTSGTWEGQFRAGGTVTTSKGSAQYHLWGSSQTNVVNNAGYGIALLQWADALGKSANDYDLYAVDSAGNVYDASQEIQDGTGTPFEAVYCETGQGLIAALASGEARPLRLQVPEGRLSIATAGAIYGHSGASSTISVAAVRAQNNGAVYNPFTSANTVETFSSDGPRIYYFDPSGNKKTSTVQAPQLAASDGVTTSVPGFTAFYGTSAAAPHAAAVAALLWSYDLTQSASDVKNALFKSALGIMASGFDRDSGYGIAMADKVFARVGPPTLSLAATVSTNEGNSGAKALKFTVKLSKKSDGAVTVNYATKNQTAKAPLDFAATSGTLTIPAGQTTGYIYVSVHGDTTYEADETFQLLLSKASVPISGSATSTATLKNDDKSSATKSVSGANS